MGLLPSSRASPVMYAKTLLELVLFCRASCKVPGVFASRSCCGCLGSTATGVYALAVNADDCAVVPLLDFPLIFASTLPKHCMMFKEARWRYGGIQE